jgi:hypothetical protein
VSPDQRSPILVLENDDSITSVEQVSSSSPAPSSSRNINEESSQKKNLQSKIRTQELVNAERLENTTFPSKTTLSSTTSPLGPSSTLHVQEGKADEQINSTDPRDISISSSKKLTQKVNSPNSPTPLLLHSAHKSKQTIPPPLPSSPILSLSADAVYQRTDTDNNNGLPVSSIHLSSSSHANMNFSSDFANSEEYQSFRSSVSLRKLAVDSDPSKVCPVNYPDALM